MKKLAVLALAGMAAATAWGAGAEWEHVGRIVGSDGRPLTGEQTLEVRLFGSMTASEVLWGRQAKAVLDADGNFSLRLGDALAPLDGTPTNSLESVLAAGPVFAEAKAKGGEGAMLPRAVVAATPCTLFAAAVEGAAGDFDVAKNLAVAGNAAVPTFRAKTADAGGNVDVADGLTVEGNLTAGGGILWGAQTGIGPMPTGTIIMWFGDENSPPDGWVFCNGENGTPDLRGRFPVGAGRQYNVGDTGGAEQVELTLEQMPSHSHPHQYALFRPWMSWEDWQWKDNVWLTDGSAQTSAEGGPDGGEEGSADAHNNLPPFMALHYIMRVE